MFDDCDVYGELTILVHEFLCAIQRIDQCKPMTVLRHFSIAEGFLSDDRQAWLSFGQAFQDQDFGTLVRFCYRRGVAFPVHIEITFIDLHDEFSGVEGNPGELVGGNGQVCDPLCNSEALPVSALMG